jgi:hypothetical protein
MPIDLKSPLAQALINVGQQRGYGPIQIAGLLGNASVENGLRTDGKPGDNGTAFGAFQWRKDRYQNLLNNASAMGKAWNDPEVQASHIYNEMDGKYGGEKRFGDMLKAARTPEEANAAVIRSLRPAGSQNGPEAAHNFGGRLGAVREAFGLLGNGEGTQVASTGPSQSDLPAEGAQDASGTLPNAPKFGTQSPVAQEPPKEGWDAFLSGGPGALFGQPQQGWNVGDALMGAGVALMARDKPEGAAALAKMMDKKSKTADDNNPDVQIDSARGLAYRKYPNGRVVVDQIRNPDPKPMPLGTQKLFQENDSKADSAYQMLQKNQEFMDLLKAGKINMSAYEKIGGAYQNFMNDSDEGTRNAARFQAHLQDMVNARLLDAKGTQTEGDAQRALDSFLPGLSKYDSKSAATMLRDINKGFESSFSRYSKYNEPILRQYKDYDPDNAFKTMYDKRMGEYTTRRDAWDKDLPNWLSPPKPAQAAPNPTSTPTGRDPVKAQPKKKSFLDFY